MVLWTYVMDTLEFVNECYVGPVLEDCEVKLLGLPVEKHEFREMME